jgi:hypothetical protein
LIEYVPAPDVTDTVPMVVVPFKIKVIVPVGVPAPGDTTASVVDSVMVWPTTSVPVAVGVVKVVAAFVAVVVLVSVGAAGMLAFPGCEYVTVQVPVGLVIVIEAVPEPVPEQLPDAVMLTGRPELAVAATVKLLPNGALAGLGVVIVIV